jgi:hypothetical protein
VAQGYSAFGEWDTSTTGRGVVWSTLSEANKAKFIKDPENNIYLEDGELIQVRYRVRVVEGAGDSWDIVTPEVQSNGPSMGYINTTAGAIAVRGSRSTSEDYGRFSNANAGRYHDQWNSFEEQTGMFRATSHYGPYDSYSSTAAHNGLCFAVPIALVSRRNSGAYHPAYNPEGCASSGKTSNVNAATALWYGSITRKALSLSDCFNELVALSTNAVSGAIGDSNNIRPDGKVYDAIYASDVQDLRMSSKKLPLTEIREKYKRMAIAGDVRGFEAVPFTTFPSIVWPNTTEYGWVNSVLSIGTSNFRFRALAGMYGFKLGDIITSPYGVHTVVNVNSNDVQFSADTADTSNVIAHFRNLISSGLPFVAVVESQQTHKQAKPTWTDIIGSPANIAATFPKGVEGQWIPVVPDGTLLSYPANRKNVAHKQALSTTDNGIGWSFSSLFFNGTTNDITQSFTASSVRLQAYETQAHFTEDSNNEKVLDLGGVSAGNFYNPSWGGLISSTLIGKVSTGSSDSKWRNASDFEYTLRTDTEILDTSTGQGVEHTTFSMLPDPSSPAVKALDYLSSENGVAKLSYAYKEMVYDSSADSPNEHTFVNQSSTFSYVAGTVYKLIHSNFVKLRDSVFVAEVSFTDTASNVDRYSLFQDGSLKSSNGSTKLVLHDGNGFGDNNQFEIANNQATQTDDNGNTVLYGTASFDTQYFVVEE